MKRTLTAVIVFVLFCAFSATADQVEPTAPSGFFGVYVGGAKAGFCAWNIELKEVGKEKYYRFTVNEERTSGDKKDTFSNNGTINLDLSARTLDSTEVRAGRTSTIKAKRTGNSIAVTVQFKGSAAMPERKVTIPPDCTWSCLAPLVFAWRKPDSSKPATINWIVESGCQAISHPLTAKTFSKVFQGEKIDQVEWMSESLNINVLTDTAGNLLSFTEKNKAGLVTSYVKEPEEVAKSPNTFDEYNTKNKDNPAKKTGKPKARSIIKDEVEGDEDGLFSSYYAPVSDDAEDSEEGDYLKEDEVFAIWAHEKWSAKKGGQFGDDCYTIHCDANSDARIIIYKQKITEEKDIIDNESDNAEKTASSQFFIVQFMLVMTGGGGSMQMGGNCTKYKFSDGKYLYSRKFTLNRGGAFKAHGVLSQNHRYNVFAFAVVPEDDWELYEDAVICMLGSFRALDDPELTEEEKDALKKGDKENNGGGDDDDDDDDDMGDDDDDE